MKQNKKMKAQNKTGYQGHQRKLFQSDFKEALQPAVDPVPGSDPRCQRLGRLEFVV